MYWDLIFSLTQGSSGGLRVQSGGRGMSGIGRWSFDGGVGPVQVRRVRVVEGEVRVWRLIYSEVRPFFLFHFSLFLLQPVLV